MQAIVGGAVPAVPVGVLMPDLIWTSYDVASGTQGGAATPSVWTTRPLNTLHHDDVGVSLASNRISLPAGTYAAVGQFATYSPEKCLHRLYDATNAVELVRSTVSVGRRIRALWECSRWPLRPTWNCKSIRTMPRSKINGWAGQ